MRKNVHTNCVNCGKDFIQTSSNEQKYCSHECYIEHKSCPPIHYICSICGKACQSKAKNTPKYCSRSCYTKARHMDNRDSRVTVQCHACGVDIKKYPRDLKQTKYLFCSYECGNKKCVQVECASCKKIYLTTGRAYQTAKFCSTKCRNERDRKEQKHKKAPVVELTCLTCKKVFNVRRTYRDKQIYCSQKCAMILIGSRHTGENSPVWKEKIKKICKKCGKIFFTHESRQNKKHYCSKECSSHKDKVTCINCGKTIELQPSRAKERVYCSRDCQLTHQARWRTLDERTNIEVALKKILEDMNHIFIEQYPVSYFTCDFWLPKFNVVIEADGEYWHDKPESKIRDKRKDTTLKKKGYKIIRLPGKQILNNPELCKTEITNCCQ